MNIVVMMNLILYHNSYKRSVIMLTLIAGVVIGSLVTNWWKKNIRSLDGI